MSIFTDLNPQALLIKGVVIVVVLVGVYFYGHQKGVAYVEAQVAKDKIVWVAKVDDLQGKLDKKATEVIVDHIVYKTVKEQVIKYITKDPIIQNVYIPAQADAQCVINKGFVELHDKAASDTTIDQLQNSDTELNKQPSDIKLSDVGRTVAENYSQYYLIKEQLNSLQIIVKDFQSKQQELVK